MSHLTHQTEIDANRMGKITSAQHEALIDRHDVALPVFVIAMPFMLAFAAGVPVFGLEAAARTFGFPIPESSSIVVICLFFIFLLIATFIVFGFTQFLKRIITLPKVNRLVQRPVVSAQGQVEWGKRNYVARVEGRRLKPVYDNAILPSPGVYSFYYLDGTRWLLSVVPLSGSVSDNQRILLEGLARANHFRPGALDANREGRFGFGQRGIVLRQFISVFFSLFWLVIGFVVIAGIAIAAALQMDITRFLTEIPREALIGAGVALVCGIGVGTFFIVTTFKTLGSLVGLWLDMLFGRVRGVEGIVTKFIDTNASDEGPTYTHYYYKVEDLQFRVSEKAYAALMGSRRYRLYYVPTLIHHSQGKPARLMINIEPT